MRKNRILVLLIILSVFCCSESESNSTPNQSIERDFISAVDISSFPKIQSTNPIFFDEYGHPADFLSLLKSNGVNTIRLRLWVNPSDQYYGIEAVKSFSDQLKSMGFDIYLTLHYSDTWADPGHQETPQNWQGIPYASLKDSVYSHTKNIVNQISPNIIQIGNEINNGLLFPEGNLFQNPNQFLELLNEGIRAVREHSVETKIMLHYAGYQGADVFFDQVNTLDYDIIGISYYPLWHGKSLDQLEHNLYQLQSSYAKDIMIAETAYPFTLDWNDWTNNIVGLEDQLILPNYPASPVGQKQFLNDLKTIVTTLESGIGFAYWGAELIAWDGPESYEGSPWENQALFDFNNRALPVLDVFEIP